MKPYDTQREYLSQYFGAKYPHIIVLRGHVPYEWEKANLKPTYTYMVDNDTGPDYSQTIVGHGTSEVHHRLGEYFHLFHDKTHVEQIIAAFPELVITTDPFGPDLCAKCSAPVVEAKNKRWFWSRRRGSNSHYHG